ncbi:MAG TPA: protein kinase [Usitatibacter sp.]|nr:protein kinase [Usitatibacter sp.]
MGPVGHARRLPRDRALHHPAAAAHEGRHGRRADRRAAGRTLRDAPRPDDQRRHVASADAAGDPPRGRARAPHHQALPRHGTRQGEGRQRGCGVQPHVGPRLPAAGPARHGIRQVPQGAAQRRGDGEHLLAGTRLRAPSPVQQGGELLPLHGDLQQEIPRHRGAHEPREEPVRDDHPRRLVGGAHQCQHDGAAGRGAGKADARPLPGGEGAGQGRHGRGLRRKGPEDRPRGRDQDDGALRGVRGRGAQEAKERFFREAETAGRLNHPNIVTIFDAGEEHDLCYIAMEFLKGKDLVGYTKQPNLLPPMKVLSIVERVADALSYAHSMGVVHRDIKPANIMYEPESDTPKVTDFGIARVTDSSRTKTGMVLGTPSYMSPEQLAGKKIDGRSDLFSLGVTLYQMLAGKLPFEGESMTQLMFAIANSPHPQIRDYNPALPEWIVPIIDKALAKDHDKRYQTGAELAEALRQARKTQAATA